MLDLALPGLEAFKAPATDPPAPPAPAAVEAPAELAPALPLPGLENWLGDVARGEPVVGSLIADYVPPPPPPPEPPSQDETHAGPVRKRGRPKSPWLVRAEQEAKERAESERSIEDEIIALALDPATRPQLIKLLDAQYARKSFAEFFKQAWKVLEPTTDLVWNWHLQLLCNVAQAVFFDWLRTKSDKKYRNRIRNVLINVPPGSSKSKIFSVCFQAWCWLYVPAFKVIAISVNDDASMRDARDLRSLVRSSWYVESFGIEWTIRDDQDAVSNFGNTAGGTRLSVASRAVIVGLRGDALLVDDANDPTENEKERKEVTHIWDSSQSNRVNDLERSLRFGIQQRTGAGDWSEHVLERQGTWWPVEERELNRGPNGWLHVVLPGEYDSARKFVLPEVLREIIREHLPPEEWMFEDPRAVDGEAMDQQRLSKDALEGERRRWEGTGNYQAQINQQPASVEGARVRRDYWTWFRLERGVRADVDDLDTNRPRPEHCLLQEKCPALVVRAAVQRPGHWDFDWITISMDCAAKKTERGSAWGILVVAGKDGRRYVLDDRTKRGDILEIIEILRELIRKWRPSSILIEDKAAGPDLKLRLLTEMQKGDMPMVELVSVTVGNDGKEARLDACISVIANGLVALLDGAPWLDKFVEELAQFPLGRQSDRVDALTQVLNHFKEYEADSWPDL